MMKLIYILVPASPFRVPCSLGVEVVYNFVKCSTVLGVKWGLDVYADVFGTGDKSDAFQDNQLKNDHMYIYIHIMKIIHIYKRVTNVVGPVLLIARKSHFFCHASNCKIYICIKI